MLTFARRVLYTNTGKMYRQGDGFVVAGGDAFFLLICSPPCESKQAKAVYALSTRVSWVLQNKSPRRGVELSAPLLVAAAEHRPVV